MSSFLQILSVVLVGCSAIMSILLFTRLRWPSPVLWLLKLYISALSPCFAMIGLVCMFWGWTTGPFFMGFMGMYVSFIFIAHIFLVTRPPDDSSDFRQAFGLNWSTGIHSGNPKYFLSKRFRLTLPSVPQPGLEQNICFATVPRTGRELLCDVWQPNKNVQRSGLAFIYLHGSAFYLLDKDFRTRSFFRQLASQGHVIMDVAYRLAPEADMMGMLNDVKRAIVWMKQNADRYKIHPDRIVIGGGSAGGHLALLAAYTANTLQFTPKDCSGKDMSVCGVVSLYGSNDLEALYYHTNQHLTTRSIPSRSKKEMPSQMPAWMVKMMGREFYRLGIDKVFEHPVAIADLLGAHPDESPEQYKLFSVATHVHPDCPPTLLVHGGHDILAPVKSTRVLYHRLCQEHVPTVMHILPQTDHGFDLTLPEISSAAHHAIYDVEQFLAILTNTMATTQHGDMTIAAETVKKYSSPQSQIK